MLKICSTNTNATPQYRNSKRWVQSALVITAVVGLSFIALGIAGLCWAKGPSGFLTFKALVRGVSITSLAIGAALVLITSTATIGVQRAEEKPKSFLPDSDFSFEILEDEPEGFEPTDRPTWAALFTDPFNSWWTGGELELPEGTPITPAIENLRKQNVVGQSVITEYFDVLESSHAHLQTFRSFLFGDLSASLPEKTKDLLAIPVVLQSWRNHIVTFLIEGTRLEYYDSKGVTLEEKGDPALTILAAKIKMKYGLTEVWENGNKHQSDSHNCGIFVSTFTARRCTGEKAHRITLNSEGANREYRLKIIQEIVRAQCSH